MNRVIKQRSKEIIPIMKQRDQDAITMSGAIEKSLMYITIAIIEEKKHNYFVFWVHQYVFRLLCVITKEI